MRTLIKNANVVLPKETRRANVLVDGEKIIDVDASANSKADDVVDATGLHLIPGVIDDHVHLREPGLTHKEDLHTGSLACAKGGVTTFLDMPNTKPPTTTQSGLEEKLALAARKSVVNFGFYVAAAVDNLPELCRIERTPGIKVFMGSSTGHLLLEDPSVLERIFAETILPICVHAEDELVMRANAASVGDGRDYSDHSRIHDHSAAIIATQRAILLAVRHKHRLHVLHVSTAGEAALLAEHHNLITAEVCPHHLLFTTSDYERLGSRVQMNPAVKTADDNEALWEALLDGRIQVIATDHAPHTLEEKAAPYPESPSGIPSVENALSLMLDQVNHGRCTLEQVVRWMCEAPARVWDIVGKGRIAEGYDADLVLVDLQRRATIRDGEQISKCKWSPWDGVELQGWPVRTWVMGCQVYDSRAPGAARGDLSGAQVRFDESVRGSEVKFDHKHGGYWMSE